MKRLWIILIAIFIISFSILGWVGTEIFRQAPPVPREVVTTDGTVLIPAEDIMNGQNVWQAMGGMQVGSIWGHGSYVAPDWSVSVGYWSARSPEFMQTDIMQTLRWMRMIGDTIFAVGAIVFVYFALDLIFLQKNPKGETIAELETEAANEPA